jgi:hypothetical protein
MDLFVRRVRVKNKKKKYFGLFSDTHKTQKTMSQQQQKQHQIPVFIEEIVQQQLQGLFFCYNCGDISPMHHHWTSLPTGSIWHCTFNPDKETHTDRDTVTEMLAEMYLSL